MFLNNKTTVFFKTESTPYTAITLSSGDTCRVRNDISYSPEIAEYRAKHLDGTLDYATSVMGRQKGSFSFTVDMAPAAAVDDVPEWSTLLQACGFKAVGWDNGSPVAVASAVEGISWVPHVDMTHTPMTFEIQEQGEGASAAMLVTKFSGCMGEVSFVIGTVGEPVQMKFEFQGVFVSMADRAYGSRLEPSGLATVKPGAVLSSTITVGAVAQDIDSFEVKSNNAIEEYIDPSKATGLAGFYISGKEPTLTLNPTLKLLATDPVYTAWVAGTTAAVSILVPNGSNPDITLSAPAAQYITVGIEDRGSARVAGKTFFLTKGSAGNDVFEILQGAKT